MPRGSSKRTGLVEAAADLFHKRGYADVSLNDIAGAAGMQQGNIYYYFKSKHELAAAVLAHWRDLAGSVLAKLQAKKDPCGRIVAFLKQSGERADMYAEWGCPIAGLSDDLLAALPAKESRNMLRVYTTHLAFLVPAFRELGLSEEKARKESYFLLAGLQGAIHLSHIMSDPGILRDFIRERTQSVRQL